MYHPVRPKKHNNNSNQQTNQKTKYKQKENKQQKQTHRKTINQNLLDEIRTCYELPFFILIFLIK